MSYRKAIYAEAYQMRENGKDDDTIRMILVSKKVSVTEINDMFVDLNQNLKPKKVKQIAGFDEESNRKIEQRGFRIWMIVLIVIGVIMIITGAIIQRDPIWIIGMLIAVSGGQYIFRDWQDENRRQQ